MMLKLIYSLIGLLGGGYTLEDIKEEVLNIEAIYCSCILIQNFRIDFDYDPLTFKPIPKDVLKSVALDYFKWGLPYGLRKTQESFRERLRNTWRSCIS